MKIGRTEVIRWAPRIAGIGLSVSLALLAVDVFIEDRGILGTLVALSMHLIPSILVLSLVIAGWKHEGFASAGFAALAVAYAAAVHERPAWVAIVCTPLVIVSALFLYGWRARTRTSVGGTRSTA